MKMPEQDCKPQGIYGGTFDPVHLAHLRLAEEAVDHLNLHSVRWIPAGQPALRAQPRASAAQRLEMVRLAIAGNPRFMLDSSEVDVLQLSYTVPTLERLRATLPGNAQRPLVLLVGADTFLGMVGWHRRERLFELVHVAVAYRPGFALSAEQLPDELARQFRQRYHADPACLCAAPAGCLVTFPMTPLDISATKIRALLARGESTRYLLADRVIDYIHRHQLYPTEH